ncbi:MAG TPA: hypothetical protein VK574_16720 [Terracidiphilus sp.]|nr:hypothetical protein [Terracidiphilus sp.]
MFESDQHEFDDEYAEISHPAPPPPPKPPAVPAASATAAQSRSVAVHEPIVEEPEEEEHEETEEADQEEFVDPAERRAEDEPPPPLKRKPNVLLLGGFGALIVFGIFVLMTMNKPKENTPPPGDLGPGIVAVDGLRGHLETRWDGDAKNGRLSYKLQIVPMEDRWGAGFSRVVSNPPMPMAVNIRLLDSTGFALCGKEIDFHFDPQSAALPVTVSAVGANGKKISMAERNAAIQAARQSQVTQMQAAEVAREKGKDLFQNQTTADGQVAALNAQGSLPCSPDQYRRVDYWDFNTNFPTLDEQAELLDPKAHAKEFDPPGHPQKRTLPKWGDGFVIQGDDRVKGYDQARGLLWAEDRTFAIDKRLGQATATAWASNYTLIHYRCDQHAICALTAAGEAAVLHARLSE